MTRTSFCLIVVFFASLALASMSAVAQEESALAQDAVEKQSKQGEIVEGPRNIREFDPADDATAVDATNIDLRKVFEDLGPDATQWHQHVQTLANPFFEGRAPGTRGGELAAEYVEFFFRQYGLQPAFQEVQPAAEDAEAAHDPALDVHAMSFRQPFDFASPDPKVEVLNIAASINEIELVNGEDFAPLGVSGNGRVTCPITFVGYGIEEGPDGYSSFEDDADLAGRIALVLRYEPLNDDGRSRWADVRFSRHSSIAPKLNALADRNAAAIILVNPPGALDGKSALETLEQSARFGPRLEVPVIQMTPETVDRLLAHAGEDDLNLMTLRKRADEGEVKTLEFPDALRITIDTDLEYDDRLHTWNVAATLAGAGDLADEWIIIGAHYDHVGYGYTGAMPDNVGRVHPGADDNASGTAGLLLAAKRLARDYETSPGSENRRSILFIAFGAEEAGLHGSKHFVKHCPLPADRIYCMLNMDMIGRLRSHNLLVQGTGTAEEFAEVLRPHFEEGGLKISSTAGGRGPSDHSTFFNAGIPVLFMFTGEHDEYHKPQDRAYTLNPAGAVQVIDLLESIALDLASREGALTFVSSPGGAGDAQRAGSRVRLGITPAYNAELETGIAVESVGEGTSAAEGGIEAGDILLSWNGTELDGARALFEQLSKAEPGQKVEIVLRRGETNQTVTVTLRGRDEG